MHEGDVMEQDLKTLYNNYHKDLQRSSDRIVLKKITKSNRKGLGKARDILVFGKSSWQTAQSWLGFPMSFIQLLALVPLAIISFNGFMSLFGVSFTIPVAYGSVIAVLIFGSLAIIGVLGWTKLGLNRRGSEINALQNPFNFLVYCKLIELEKKF